MRFARFFSLTACFLWGLSFASMAAAQNSLVVVELYTSQGCSSCPPADALLHKLAERDDILPLALHVDYWDYIGWKDDFANPAFTKRQRVYAKVAGRRSVYTPQMIVNGTESIVGARGLELSEAIAFQKTRQTGVEVRLTRSGKGVLIEATARDAAAPMVVQILRYKPLRKVKITRGENAGHNFSYANVVYDLRVLEEWSGKSDLSLTADVQGEDPVVILIQSVGQGPIQAAARLR